MPKKNALLIPALQTFISIVRKSKSISIKNHRRTIKGFFMIANAGVCNHEELKSFRSLQNCWQFCSDLKLHMHGLHFLKKLSILIYRATNALLATAVADRQNLCVLLCPKIINTNISFT